MSTFPRRQEVLLVNGIRCTTVVSLIRRTQVAQITFTTAAGENLGDITLSHVQPSATNVEFRRGEQLLQVTHISFRAAFGLDTGQVTCSGSATDQNGNHTVQFSRQLTSWSLW